MINLKSLKPNKPQALLESYVWTVFGRPKVGKTSLFHGLVKAKYEDTHAGLLLAFEKGYQAMSDIVAQDVDDWASFVEITDQLIDDRDELPFKLLGFDTVDVLWNMATEYIIARQKIADKKPYKVIGDIPYGAGYDMVDKEVNKQLGRLHKAGYGLFFITHEKDKKFTSRDGTEFDKTTVNLPNRARDTILNMSDFIVFIDTVKVKEGDSLKDERVIYFRSDGDIEAGSRFQNIEPKIDYDIELFLETFEKAVLNEYKGDTKAVDKARKEQQVEREEKVQEYIEQTKTGASRTAEDFHALIGEAIEKLNDDGKAKVKSEFKSTLGTINYKKVDDLEQLEQALSFVESL